MLISVQERFFATVQGEGLWTGAGADFIRLGGCNVGCAWCDTGYAKGSTQPRSDLMSVKELVSNLQSKICVVTGGEPYQQPNLDRLVLAILDRDIRCHIETSGTTWRDLDDRAWITLSPKERYTGKIVDPRFWERADEIKMIISEINDLQYYMELLQSLPLRPECQIFFQPEYSQRELMIPVIVNGLQYYPIAARLSLQTHKYIGLR